MTIPVYPEGPSADGAVVTSDGGGSAAWKGAPSLDAPDPACLSANSIAEWEDETAPDFGLQEFTRGVGSAAADFGQQTIGHWSLAEQHRNDVRLLRVVVVLIAVAAVAAIVWYAGALMARA